MYIEGASGLDCDGSEKIVCDKNKYNTPKMTISSQIHYCSKDELF